MPRAGAGRNALAGLVERLRARRGEIEQTILNRAHAISDPADTSDPAYAEGLRDSVSTALDYGLAAVAAHPEQQPMPPPGLLAQARLAARSDVGLDVVLRRYFAGYALLADALAEEAEGELGPAQLKCLMRGQASIFDQLLAAISAEYSQEAENRPMSSERRRAAQVRRLLAGELIDTTDFDYPFDRDCTHLGLVATGPDVRQALLDLAGALDRRLLVVQSGEVVWAWLGSRWELDSWQSLQRHLAASWPSSLSLAIGEPGKGVYGWRLTHRQAAVTLPIALRGSSSVVRYAHVALLASAASDDLLAPSLRQLYLDPLSEERDGGKLARETLQAYFAADRHASSAAAALGVNRNTVTSRLRAIERRLGHSLGPHLAELEVALKLERLTEESEEPTGQISVE